MNLLVSLQAVAAIKGVSAEEAAEAVSQNSIVLYGRCLSRARVVPDARDIPAIGAGP
jgi:hypothetical protein